MSLRSRLGSHITALALGLIVLAAAPVAAGETTVVEAREHGLVPNSGRNLTPVLKDLLAKLPARLPAKLRFAPGRYDFWAEGAASHFVSCSNNDSGNKPVVFDLASRAQLEIDGQGAQFIFHGGVLPLWLSGSRQVTLRNFSVDWEKPYLLELSITRSSADEADMTVRPGYDYSVKDGKLFFRPEDGIDYPADRANGFDGTAHKLLFGARNGFTFSGVVNRSKPAPPRTNKGVPVVTETGPRQLHFRGRNLPVVPPGTRVAYMNLTERVHRLYPAIVIDRSSDVVVESVKVHSAFGMALMAQFSHNIKLLSYTVTPSDDRIASTRADATHFTMCSGEIRMEHCLFEGSLDDAANVHGMWVRLKQITAPRSVVVSRVHIQQETSPFAEPGDKLELRSEGMDILGQTAVTAVREIDQTDLAIELATPLPAALQPGAVLHNLSRQPDVVIRDCTLRKNGGRGFLITTAGQVLVENNFISTPAGPGVLILGHFDHWGESGPVRDITIRRNRFEDCASLAFVPTAAIAVRPEPKNKSTAFHQNIRVEENVFSSPHNRLIDIRHSDGVVIEKNHFFVSGAAAAIAEVVTTEDCGRVSLRP